MCRVLRSRGGSEMRALRRCWEGSPAVTSKTACRTHRRDRVAHRLRRSRCSGESWEMVPPTARRVHWSLRPLLRCQHYVSRRRELPERARSPSAWRPGRKHVKDDRARAKAATFSRRRVKASWPRPLQANLENDNCDGHTTTSGACCCQQRRPSKTIVKRPLYTL